MKWFGSERLLDKFQIISGPVARVDTDMVTGEGPQTIEKTGKPTLHLPSNKNKRPNGLVHGQDSAPVGGPDNRGFGEVVLDEPDANGRKQVHFGVYLKLVKAYGSMRSLAKHSKTKGFEPFVSCQVFSFMFPLMKFFLWVTTIGNG